MAFQEVKIEDLSFNPFTKIGKEWLLITAGNEESYNTMTASWGGVGVMWGKNAVTVYIRYLVVSSLTADSVIFSSVTSPS